MIRDGESGQVRVHRSWGASAHGMEVETSGKQSVTGKVPKQVMSWRLVEGPGLEVHCRGEQARRRLLGSPDPRRR